jgi:Family of unknown function (DUF6364)
MTIGGFLFPQRATFGTDTMRTISDNTHMKQRLNLTIDADLIRLARRVAHERDTSVSALVEEYLLNLASRGPGSGAAFVAKWAGRLSLAPPDPEGDPRREYLWRKFALEQSPAVVRESRPTVVELAAEQQEPGCES